jgi:hypothetical protein
VADASRLEPTDERWDTVVPALAGKRLNASGTAEDLAQRWSERNVVTRLSPNSDWLEAQSNESQAAPPRPTPASTRTKNPFRLHRVRGAKR